MLTVAILLAFSAASEAVVGVGYEQQREAVVAPTLATRFGAVVE